MTNIVRIDTHQAPHLDEIVAILLLRKYGEQQFPGVSTAPIGYLTQNADSPLLEERSASDLEAEGVLMIGVGGGRFDEHPTHDRARREGECATTLVAQALGLDNDKSFDQLIEYVRHHDTKGGGSPYDLGRMVQAMHDQHPDNPELVINWVNLFLEAKLKEQFQFHGETALAYGRDAVVEMIPGPNGQQLRLVWMQTDLKDAGRFSRSPLAKDGPSDIFVQRNGKGQVQIFTNSYGGRVIDLSDVIKMLRWFEQNARGVNTTWKFNELGQKGKVAGAECWYYQEDTQIILNGSKSYPNTEPTKLSFDEVIGIVKLTMDTTKFAKSHAPRCREGVCSHQESPCAWYPFGLKRCSQIRFLGPNGVPRA